MLIRVEQGKGRKDRYVMLAPDLLEFDTPEPVPPSSLGHGSGPTAPHAAERHQSWRSLASTPGSTRAATAPGTSRRRWPPLAAAVIAPSPTARHPVRDAIPIASPQPAGTPRADRGFLL